MVIRKNIFVVYMLREFKIGFRKLAANVTYLFWKSLDYPPRIRLIF